MRFDIQLLRVVAVVSVVLCHFFPGFVPGGFVGVDIFFVISGFLMTNQLIKWKLESRFSVFNFWLLRATRLFPQALFVVFSVALATVILLPSRDRIVHMPDAIASALFGENLLLAWESTDYFAAEQKTSALQHFWSLAVEEQFYVMLPLVLAGAFLISNKAESKFSSSKALMVAVSGFTILSGIIYSQYLVETGTSAQSYFLTFSRIWELAIGVLVALLATSWTARERYKPIAGSIGMALLAFAVFAFSSQTPFPGVAALVPTVGTALVILFGPWKFLAQVGSFRPFRWVADHSYGIYLWHWPLLTLWLQVTGDKVPPVIKFVLIATSFALAWVSSRFIEAPIRKWGKARILRGQFRIRIGLGVLVTIGLVVSLPAFAYTNAFNEQQSELQAAQERFQQSQQQQESTETLASCVGPEELDPEIQCIRPSDGFDFFPSLDAAHADDDNRKECWSTSDSQRFNICDLGELTNFSKEVFIVGDSHAAALLGAFDLLGKREGWKITFAGKGGCFWTAAPLKKPESMNTQYCLEWRDKIQAYLDAHPPYDFMIVTNSARTARGVLTSKGQTFEAPATDGLVRAWESQTSRGVPIFAIKDNPFPIADHLDCIAMAVQDPRVECDIPTWDGFEAFDPIVAATEKVDGAYLVDLSYLYCDPEFCSPIVGGVLVYRDDSHITGTWAKMLEPYIARQIESYLAKLGL